MLTTPLRKFAEPLLAPGGSRLARFGAQADLLTAIGFLVGLAAIPAIASHNYLIGLGLILLNRLIDALDGAVARQTQATGRGAFLDMTLDLIVFAAIPFAFALADPSRALAAAFFIFAIATSGVASIAFAALASRQGSTGEMLFSFVGRIMEDTELTLALVIACIFPAWFGVVAYVAGALCFLTAGARIATAFARFGEP
jgi:phosphatidylglycerophosphate synthase